MAKKFKEVLSHTYTCGIKGTPADLDPINLKEDSIMITNFRRWIETEVPVPVSGTMSAKEGVAGDVITLEYECDGDLTDSKVSVVMLKGVKAPAEGEQVTIAGKKATAKFELTPVDQSIVNAIFGVTINGITRLVVMPVKKVTGVIEEAEVKSPTITVGSETIIAVKVADDK